MDKPEKHFYKRYVFLGLLALALISMLVFMRFGGFNTGTNGNPEEFLNYAQPVENITIPEDSKIIALGEATHGNVEFQELKLDVFKQMVEKYDVKAFVIEGDYAGSEVVNRYIHGGKGSSEEAAAAIGFAIYRTEEIAQLISYMRDYNETVAKGEDLRFYGFDMQRPFYNFKFLIESSEELGVDTTELQKLMNDETWSDAYNYQDRIYTISEIKDELIGKENSAEALHFADMLLQYCELQTTSDFEGSDLRDKFMAENVEWVLGQEQKLGHNRIFVSAHNSHVAKWGSFDSMGKLLSNRSENEYYAIGSDFYKAKVNLPTRSSTKRRNRVFYSHDPLAKTAQMAGLDITWLDFETVPSNSELGQIVSDYTYMGSLGESYSWFMRLLPPSYRMFQPPGVLYDSMIFVSDAKPTKILAK